MRLTICLAAVAFLAFAAEHAELNGTWQDSTNGETLAINAKDDGSVQISQSGKESAELRCRTTGESCKIKGGEISMWYNGPTLVIMETMHGNSRVIKTRLKVAEDGKTLEQEIVHIQPAGNTEKVTLVRHSGS